MKLKRKNQKGFTLVEMIVVIAIIGVLAAMMVPSLLGYIEKANISNNRAAAATIGRAAAAIAAEGNITATKSTSSASTDFARKLKGMIENTSGHYAVTISGSDIKVVYNKKNAVDDTAGYTSPSTRDFGYYPDPAN